MDNEGDNINNELAWFWSGLEKFGHILGLPLQVPALALWPVNIIDY